MDYKALYARFIDSRRDRVFFIGEYSERHHIVPRCEGGGDEASNLIRLTARDHIFAHLILAKWKGGVHWLALQFAFTGLKRERRLPTAQEVRIMSKAREEAASVPRAGFYTPEVRVKMSRSHTGKVLSEEHCAKISRRNKGNSYRLGIPNSPETRAKISARQKGRKLSPEHVAKSAAAQRGQARPSIKGKPLSAEHRAKIGAGNKGGPGRLKPHTEETRAKLSKSNKAAWERKKASDGGQHGNG